MTALYASFALAADSPPVSILAMYTGTTGAIYMVL